MLGRITGLQTLDGLPNICLAVLAMLMLSHAACTSQAPIDREAEFKSVLSRLGARTDPNLQMGTKAVINSNDLILYFVENHTNQTVYFRDESLDMRVYQYDESDQIWRRLALDRTILHPNELITVPPNDPKSFPADIFAPSWVE